ncbi:MAG TPA: hypothetical protein VKZ63_07670 [Kofleriaceae bacterium]|nr:hypothetical protein [Kofleriaceae bacterium]
MVWQRTIAAWIAALACAACGGDDASGVDAGPGDGDAGADGGPPSGVTVEFVPLGANAQPASGQGPIELEDFRVDTITIQMHDLRLIGDTAPSGSLVLDSRAVQFPAAPTLRVSFEMAPPGLYSRLTFDVERTWAEETVPDGFEGQRLAVRVLGEAHIGNRDRRFEYVDDQRIGIDLGFDEEVAPGVPGSVVVELDLGEWFGDVDWRELDERGGGNKPMVIGMGEHPDIAELLRAGLSKAFEVRE